MTKKVRQQIDVSNIFIEETNCAASRATTQRLDAWPILIAIHSLTKQQAKIHQVHYPMVNNFDQYEIHMMTDRGQSIASVSRGRDGVFHVFSSDRPYHDGILCGSNFTSRIESKNLRYVVKKLAESSEHDVRVCITNAMSNAVKATNQILRDILNDSIYTMTGKFLYRFLPKLPDNNNHYSLLLRHFMGDIKREELSLETVRDLDNDYKKWMNESSSFREVLERINTLYSHDKWVVMPRVHGGLMVGAISFHPLQTAVREAANDNGTLPSSDYFNYVQEVVPFKWYKSFDSIPEDILAELNLSALMLKAHTGSDKLFPDVIADKVYEDIEAVACRHDGVSFYVFNK